MRHNPVVRALALLIALALAAGLTAVGLFFYAFSIPDPQGLSLASWPDQFAKNFSSWLTCGEGEIGVEPIGLQYLEQYGAWLQVLDEEGREVLACGKPAAYPQRYTAAELMALSESPYADGYTLFTGSHEEAGRSWGYVIGYPYAVGKHMLYVNGENVRRLSPAVRRVILAAFLLAALTILGCGVWLACQLGQLTQGIERIALRAYGPMKEKGMFGGVRAALNRMDAQIRRSDSAQAETDRARREWIANITHDLKTPLSPVRGYAELLADGADAETARAYGRIMKRNIERIEGLIGDLKLTYQLDSGAAPFDPKRLRLTRLVREWVIDIVNDPAYAGRDIAFEGKVPELTVSADEALLRRAVQNLVINALVHNPPHTKVQVFVGAQAGGACICVRDDGVGLSEREQEQLFTRYYRGTDGSSGGSGLGLAIARQIVELHGGGIAVQSRRGEGTEFVILLPAGGAD